MKKNIFKKLIKTLFTIWLTTLIVVTSLIVFKTVNVAKIFFNINAPQEVHANEQTSEDIEPSPSPSVIPVKEEKVIYKPVDPYANDINLKGKEWGEAVKTETGSYTMKVGMDSQMSTPNELYEALMTYRNIKGKSRLTWDDKLAEYATQRASYICENGSDQHAGFSEYLDDGGYEKLGFRGLGENMSYNMKMSGVHLIEWIYSKSPGHEANQVGQWSHIGTGISGSCSVLIFGDHKM